MGDGPFKPYSATEPLPKRWQYAQNSGHFCCLYEIVTKYEKEVKWTALCLLVRCLMIAWKN